MKRVFKNFATKYTIRKQGVWWCFYEGYVPTFGSTLYPTRAKAVRAMQRHSMKYYGEKSK